MQSPNYGSYGFMECFLVHCLLCGQHHENTNHYCMNCMAGRFDEVEKDAKIRAYSGNWGIVSVCSHKEEGE